MRFVRLVVIKIGIMVGIIIIFIVMGSLMLFETSLLLQMLLRMFLGFFGMFLQLLGLLLDYIDFNLRFLNNSCYDWWRMWARFDTWLFSWHQASKDGSHSCASSSQNWNNNVMRTGAQIRKVEGFYGNARDRSRNYNFNSTRHTYTSRKSMRNSHSTSRGANS